MTCGCKFSNIHAYIRHRSIRQHSFTILTTMTIYNSALVSSSLQALHALSEADPGLCMPAKDPPSFVRCLAPYIKVGGHMFCRIIVNLCRKLRIPGCFSHPFVKATGLHVGCIC